MVFKESVLVHERGPRILVYELFICFILSDRFLHRKCERVDITFLVVLFTGEDNHF